jgi:hypothetical protein
MRDSGSDPISREPREGWWFAAPPHCGLHSPTRGYGRRLPATLLDSLSALAHRRSCRSCSPSSRTMDGYAFRRNCSSFSAHLLHSLGDGNARPTRSSTRRLQRGSPKMSLTCVLRRPGRPRHCCRQRRGYTGTNEALPGDRWGRVEPFDRTASESCLSCSHPDLHDVLLACRRRRCSRSGPSHHVTRLRLGRDRRCRRLHRHERARGERVVAPVCSSQPTERLREHRNRCTVAF